MIISGQKAEAWRCFLLQCHSSFQAKISAHDERSLSIIIVIASNKEVRCSFRTSPHLDNACVSKHNRAAEEYKVSKKMSRVITKVRFFVSSHSWPMNIDGSTKEGGVAARYVVQKMMMLEVTPKTICHPRSWSQATDSLESG